MKSLGFGCACAALGLLAFGGHTEAAKGLAFLGAFFVLVS
jgi:hypothetical protein